MATTRDYSSIYSIKDFAMNEVAPKYFDMDTVSDMNIGLLGYTTELVANTTEDTFNSISTYIREIFPNLAQIPETLYNHAAMLQIENLFAKPAKMTTVVFVSEKDILSLGTPKDNRIEFILDSDLTIDVEGKQFMLDYDIMISAKPYASDYIYTASYDFSFRNSLSSLSNPYIKTKRVKLNNTNYLGLLVDVHQVNKFEQVEYIINNDKINLPTLNFEFIDQLANFEVYYKSPDSNQYIQLKKRLFNSTPLKEPFCFYRFKDTNKVEISFTMRDNYFQPQFNSEILLHIYTTTGKEGNFPLYQGNDISVVPKSDVYEYNNTIILFSIPQSESVDGTNRLSLEELRNAIIERSSTSGAYNVENDLQLYFSSYQSRDNTDVLFIKKRDDALERLFAAFAIFKDPYDNFYPTNTLNMDLLVENFDIEYEQSNKFILKSGHLFKYKPNNLDTVEMIPVKTLKDDLSSIPDEFVYTNPFLITMSKNPNIVGFYLNSVADRIPMEYSYVNNDSIVQFLCNNLFINRNSMMGEDFYKLQVVLNPTSELETPIVDPTTNADLGNLKVIMAVEDTGGEMCYIEFSLVKADTTTNLYTFEATLTTDDYMTFGQRMRVLNAFDIETNVQEVKLIPMNNCKVNIYTLFKYPDMKLEHKFDILPNLQPYTMTNMYTTNEKPINFIMPLDIMRSRVKYKELNETDFYMALSHVPMVKAETLKNPVLFSDFLNTLYKLYDYLQDSVNKITNNYGIDMKFYNTFGKSKNFLVGENNEKLDKVNIKVQFRVAPTIGVIEDDLIRDLRVFIKTYIEGINNKGYNSIYMSNLIREIENNFENVRYLKFISINAYDSMVQVIENRGLDINLLTKEERKDYVPEFLTMGLDDITIEIIRSN